MRIFGLLSTIVLIIFSGAVYAQQDSNWKSRTYDLSDFREIELEGGYRVFLIQGDENSLLVKASDDDVFDYLDINSNTSSLKLRINREHFNFDRINLYITFKELERVNIEGGVRLKTRGYLDLDDFEMHVEGGAKVELNMKAKDVDIVSQGGVLFEMNGVAETLNVKVSGAGHVDASELKTKDVRFSVEGVGTGSVYATDNLYAHIQGVGKIKYRGNPQITKSIDGVGTVTSE